MISAKAKSTAPTPASTANLGGRRGAPPKHRARTRIAAGRGPELEFDVPGADSTQGRGINDSGQIVGSYGAVGHAPDYERSYARHGFLDDHGVFSRIDVPGASRTVVNGITDADPLTGRYLVVGGYQVPDRPGVPRPDHGFVAELASGGTTSELTPGPGAP